MMRSMKKLVKGMPYFRSIVAERDRLRAQMDEMLFPPGHFHSPIPSLEEIRGKEAEVFGTVPRQLAGIDLNERGQLALLDEFTKFYPELPWSSHKTDRLRYYYENGSYGHSDGIGLFCMMRHLRPKQIVEVGCGNSSCLILDTNDLFLGNAVSCTFIEPEPERFLSFVRDDDRRTLHLLGRRLQDVELSLFRQLGENDILFIDSTHVAKINSDVNYLFFEILPALQPGVVVHIHDVFYPFEYPKEWIYEGRAWNEAYLLRAFLQYNRAFEILFCNTFLQHFHTERIRAAMPLCLKIPGGSIWLRKVQPG